MEMTAIRIPTVFEGMVWDSFSPNGQPISKMPAKIKYIQLMDRVPRVMSAVRGSFLASEFGSECIQKKSSAENDNGNNIYHHHFFQL